MGSSSTGTMSNPQPQGSIEEDTNQTPRAHTPATLTVGSYEWALEQKQQLVDNPPPLVTEDVLVSYLQRLTTLDRVIASLAPKPSTVLAPKVLAIRTQNAPYMYHSLNQLVKKDPPTLETTNQK
jgi:hypothetical protein